MTDWQTMTAFATGDILNATRAQAWWRNTDILHSPNIAGIDGPGPANDWWTFTPTGVWTDIDATYYRVTVECTGNPVMLWSRFQCGHSAASGEIYLTYEIDGLRYGNTNGLAYFNSQLAGVIAGVEMSLVVTPSAGVHEVVAQVQNHSAGDAKIWKNGNLGIFVMEF